MHTQVLLRNLAALAQVAPVLAERLTFSVSSDHIREVGGTRTITYRRRAHPLKGGYPQTLPAREVRAVGASDPMSVAQWLAAGNRVHLWDRDPWLLRTFLDAFDFTRAIRSGALTLHLGADIVDLAHLPGPVVPHRILGLIYRDAVALLEARAVPRAIVVEGELFVDDAIDAVRDEGFSVYRMDVTVPSLEEIAYTLLRLTPRFVLCINHRPGLGLLCATRNVPLLTWEIDPSTSRWRPRDEHAHVSLHTYRPSTLPLLRRVGFVKPRALPLATNPERRRPTPAEGIPGLTLVGRSMVLEAEDHRRRLLTMLREPSSVLEEVLAEQRRDWTTYRIPELVREHLETSLVESDSRDELDLVQLVGELAAAEKRVATAEKLVSLGLVAWGDAGWRSVRGLDYRGPASHTEDLNRIYSNSVVNVDISRLYQEDIVTMRVFDVLACGGFVLSPHNELLQELFEVGQELDSYGSLDELYDKSAFYLRHERVARSIARRGRTRVLRDHTIRHRLREMLTLLPAQVPDHGAVLRSEMGGAS